MSLGRACRAPGVETCATRGLWGWLFITDTVFSVRVQPAGAQWAAIGFCCIVLFVRGPSENRTPQNMCSRLSCGSRAASHDAEGEVEFERNLPICAFTLSVVRHGVILQGHERCRGIGTSPHLACVRCKTRAAPALGQGVRDASAGGQPGAVSAILGEWCTRRTHPRVAGHPAQRNTEGRLARPNQRWQQTCTACTPATCGAWRDIAGTQHAGDAVCHQAPEAIPSAGDARATRNTFRQPPVPGQPALAAGQTCRTPSGAAPRRMAGTCRSPSWLRT